MENGKEIKINKTRDSIIINRIIQFCYRQKKYPIGDIRRECHLGFQEINDKCLHCKWFSKQIKRSMMATGKELDKLQLLLDYHATGKLDAKKNIIESNIKELKEDENI